MGWESVTSCSPLCPPHSKVVGTPSCRLPLEAGETPTAEQRREGRGRQGGGAERATAAGRPPGSLSPQADESYLRPHLTCHPHREPRRKAQTVVTQNQKLSGRGEEKRLAGPGWRPGRAVLPRPAPQGRAQGTAGDSRRQDAVSTCQLLALAQVPVGCGPAQAPLKGSWWTHRDSCI